MRCFFFGRATILGAKLISTGGGVWLAPLLHRRTILKFCRPTCQAQRLSASQDYGPKGKERNADCAYCEFSSCLYVKSHQHRFLRKLLEKDTAAHAEEYLDTGDHAFASIRFRNSYPCH